MKKVTLLGAVNIDIQGFSQKKALLSDCNVGNLMTTPGGVARNIAEVMSRLEIPVAIVSAIGTDTFGDQLLENLRALNINSSMVLKKDGPSSSYTGILDYDGSFVVGLSDMHLIESITVEDIHRWKDQILDSEFLVVDTCLSTEVLQTVCEFPMDIYLDPVGASKVEKVEPIISNIRGIKVNPIEAKYLTGIELKTKEDAKKIVEVIHNKGPKEVFLSFDSGLFFSDGTSQFSTAQKEVDAVNVSGAGDTAFGAILAAYAKGFSWKEALNYGMIAARLSVKSMTPVSDKISWAALDCILEEDYDA